MTSTPLLVGVRWGGWPLVSEGRAHRRGWCRPWGLRGDHCCWLCLVGQLGWGSGAVGTCQGWQACCDRDPPLPVPGAARWLGAWGPSDRLPLWRRDDEDAQQLVWILCLN